ncbi:MAG: hypothetical protein AAB676_17695 [Verrucomicrobiota bacterium]
MKPRSTGAKFAKSSGQASVLDFAARTPIWYPLHWIDPSEKDSDNDALEKRRWAAQLKCEVLNPRWEVPSVRHSRVLTRTSAARASEQELRRQLAA